MKNFRKNIVVIVLLAAVFEMSSCFKSSFPVVGPPDDVTGDSITSPPTIEQGQRKVLIIDIDGVTGEAMKLADAPNIHGLLPHAVYSYDAVTQPPAIRDPGWASLLTGVWSKKTGVNSNSLAENNFKKYPSVVKYIKTLNPRFRVASFCSSSAINDYLLKDANIKVSTNGNNQHLSDSVVTYLKEEDPDLMFVQFGDVDAAGSQYGYDTTITEYMQAITKVDGYVGNIMKALTERPGINEENWLVIITSGHGGSLSGSTDGTGYDEKSIFTVFYNKTFTEKEILPPENVLKSIKFQALNQNANLKDTSDIIDFDSYKGFSIHLEMKSSDLSGWSSFLTNKNWFDATNPGWAMAVNGGTTWTFNAGDGSHRIDVSGGELSDGKWHSLAVTIDKKGYAKLFQDDSLYGFTSAQNISEWNGDPSYGVNLNSGDDITGDLSASYGKSIFNIADIKIWDTVISDKDMVEYKSCDSTFLDGKYRNNLVVWWKATDGSDNIWKDYGPNHLDMQLSGDPSWVTQQFDFCNIPLPPSVPTLVDVVPSVFSWLHIPVDSGWKLDGTSWLP